MKKYIRRIKRGLVVTGAYANIALRVVLVFATMFAGIWLLSSQS